MMVRKKKGLDKKHMDKQDTFYDELDKRITMMEQPGYPYPQRFGRRDFLLWGLVILICLAFLLLGAWL